MIPTTTWTPKHAFSSLTASLLVAFLLVGNLPVVAKDAAKNTAKSTAILSARDIFHPVFAGHGMVSTQEATATRIGVDILKKAATPWTRPSRWDLRWQSPCRGRETSAVADS